MGQFREVERMFRGVSYSQFQTTEPKAAFATKIDAVKMKIQERRGRVSKLIKIPRRVESEPSKPPPRSDSDRRGRNRP